MNLQNDQKTTDGTMRHRLARLAGLAVLLAAMLGLSGCVSNLNALVGSGGAPRVSNAEAVQALKDALEAGARYASDQLSATDGYYGQRALRIGLPPEAQVILDNLARIPQGQRLVDDLILRLNRAAEAAAAEVAPIFGDAIRAMTVADGLAIVRGHDRAATEYLERSTGPRIHASYQPRIQAALDRRLVANVSANQAWTALESAYNQAGRVVNNAAALAGRPAPMPPVQLDLAAWATEQAMNGLFFKIGEEEEKIRANPLTYASAAIQKVFGALKDGRL